MFDAKQPSGPALTLPRYTFVMQRSPRFVIATPICDGHDVAAAAITRILRAQGMEAVYVGFNKSAYQIAKAASEEDATGIAVSTYNGGHMSFLREVLAEQARQGITHVPLFAGGGGTILEREVGPLMRMGVTKVYRPPLDLAEAVRDMTTLANEAAGERPASSREGRNAVPYACAAADRHRMGRRTAGRFPGEWQARRMGHRRTRRGREEHAHRRAAAAVPPLSGRTYRRPHRRPYTRRPPPHGALLLAARLRPFRQRRARRLDRSEDRAPRCRTARARL